MVPAAQGSAEEHKDEFGKLRLRTAQPKSEIFLLSQERDGDSLFRRAPDAPSMFRKHRTKKREALEAGVVAVREEIPPCPRPSPSPPPDSLGNRRAGLSRSGLALWPGRQNEDSVCDF